MRIEIESVDELRLLTDALLMTREADERAEPEPESDEEAVPEEMDPLIDKLLSQAEASQVGTAFEVEVDEEESDRLGQALEALMEQAAEEGDLFRTGEIQVLLKRLGRG